MNKANIDITTSSKHKALYLFDNRSLILSSSLIKIFSIKFIRNNMFNINNINYVNIKIYR